MRPLEIVQDYVVDGIFVCAIVVFAAIVIVELIKPWLRGRLQLRYFRSWASGSKHHVEKLLEMHAPPEWLRRIIPSNEQLERLQAKVQRSIMQSYEHRWAAEPWEPAGSHLQLGSAAFMRLVQNEANALLEAPLRDINRFVALTKGAPHQDQVSALYLHAVRRHDPALLAEVAQISEEPKGRADALVIAAVRANLAAAAERNLDALQLGLRSHWQSSARAISRIAGLLAAVLLGLGSRVIAPSFLLIVLVPVAVALGGFAGFVAVEWLDRVVAWIIPDWLRFGLVFAAAASSLALSVWAYRVGFGRGWIAASTGAADMLGVGVIAGIIAPLAYDSVRALFARRT